MITHQSEGFVLCLISVLIKDHLTDIVSLLALVVSFLRKPLSRGPQVSQRRSLVRISEQGELWVADEDHPEVVELRQRQQI